MKSILFSLLLINIAFALPLPRKSFIKTFCTKESSELSPQETFEKFLSTETIQKSEVESVTVLTQAESGRIYWNDLKDIKLISIIDVLENSDTQFCFKAKVEAVLLPQPPRRW